MNVIEDEIETNKKINTLVDIAARLLVGAPQGEAEGKTPQEEGYVGQEPNKNHPDVHYTVEGGHGEQIGIHKVMSTEFDKILESGGKYQGTKVEPIKGKEHA
jgi:hypothetical protein